MRLVLLAFIGTFAAFAQVSTLQPERATADLRLWKISAIALAGASALDVASSWGKCCERNELLASPDGRFGGRAVAVKSGALGGQVLLQYFVARRSPKVALVLSFVNFAGAGAITAISIRNYGIPQRNYGAAGVR